MDLIDKKVLIALSADSRQSRTKLAKKLRISKSTLLYRIEKLENDFIQCYTTIVDHSSFSDMYVRVAVRGTIKKAPFMVFFAHVHGMYDAVFSFYARTLNQAQDIIDSIRPTVDTMHVSFALHIHTCFPRVYSLNESPLKSSFTQLGNCEKIKHYEVLDYLEKNPRKSINDVAKALSLSTKTVMSHKRELEKSKIIQKYSISINSKSFGFEQAHIFWSDASLQTSVILKDFLANEKTVYITQTFGGKLESEYLFRSHKELHDFFSEIQKKFGVIAESYFVYN